MKQNIVQTAYEAACGSRMAIKHGAVIFSGGKALISTCNSDRSTIGGCLCYSAHAEVVALYRLRNSCIKYHRKRLNMLVVRVGGDMELSYSRPCNNCIMLMQEFNIKKVYYSADSGLICEYPTNMDLIHISMGYRVNDYLPRVRLVW